MSKEGMVVILQQGKKVYFLSLLGMIPTPDNSRT